MARFILGTVAACFLSGTAIAGECEDLLAGGVFDTTQVSVDYAAQLDWYEYVCSETSSVSAETRSEAICKDSSSGSATIGEGSVSLIEMFSGSSNIDVQRTFRERYCNSNNSFDYAGWSALHCQETTSSSSSSSVVHTLIQRANSDLIQGYVECKSNSLDLICIGTEHGDLVSVEVIWNHEYAETMTVDSFVHPNLTMFGPATANSIREINKGSAKWVFERKDSKKTAVVQINATETVNDEPRTRSCEYAIPPQPCQNPIYNTMSSELCGPDHYVTAKAEICGALTYHTKRGEVCGPELFEQGKGGPCGTTVINHRITGGCSEASTYCRLHFGGGNAFNCQESGSKVRYDCAVPNTCRAKEFGVELWRSCDDISFGVREWKECSHPSNGVIYKVCSHPSFGTARCADE